MAGLFKTGQELQQERYLELLKGAPKFTQLEQTDPLVAGLGKFGAALGTGLGQKLSEGDTKAAGDVDLANYDLGTAKGNFAAAKALRAAGFEAEAADREDRGVKLHMYESSVAEEQAAAGASGKVEDVPEPTDNQLQGINNYWMLRTDATGELANQIMEEAADNPVAAAGLKHMNRLIAVNSNEMIRDLTKQHGLRFPRTMVERAMVDVMAEGGTIGKSGFLFWKDPVVDVKKAERTIQAVRREVMDMLLKQEAGDEPVKTEPAQQTTQMEPVPDVPEAPAPAEELPEGTEVGQPIPREQASPGVALGDPLPTTRLDYANELKAIDQELRRAKKADQIIGLQRRRNELIKALSQLK